MAAGGARLLRDEKESALKTSLNDLIEIIHVCKAEDTPPFQCYQSGGSVPMDENVTKTSDGCHACVK